MAIDNPSTTTSSIPNDEQYLTVQQLCSLLQVTRQTLYTWDKKNILSRIRIGTRIRYKLSEVQAILDSQLYNPRTGVRT